MNIFLRSSIRKGARSGALKSERDRALRSGRARALILCAAVALLLALMFVSVMMGAVKIKPGDIWRILSGAPARASDARILLYVRLPRVFCATLSGAALACSGAILQTALGNPMCGPNIIGANAGAGLAIVALAALFPGAAGFAPIAAFLGALLAVSVVYAIAKKTGASGLAVILAGIAISGLFSALTDLVITLYPQARANRIDFLIGGFAGVSMASVRFAAPYILFGLAASFAMYMHIDALALGDSVAASLGLRVSLVRGVCIGLAALLAGSAISLAGLIGFVGLLVPHIAKAFAGYEHKYALPLSAALGGAFCLFCDIIARTLFAPFEAPVGIVMSLIGSPFFIWLVLSRRRRPSFD